MEEIKSLRAALAIIKERRLDLINVDRPAWEILMRINDRVEMSLRDAYESMLGVD